MTNQETFIVTDALNNEEAVVTNYASVNGYMYTKSDLVEFVNNELRQHEIINAEKVDTSRDLTVDDNLDKVTVYLNELGYDLTPVHSEA